MSTVLQETKVLSLPDIPYLFIETKNRKIVESHPKNCNYLH